MTIRAVEPADVPAVVAMVHELAEYERGAHDCHLTADQLHAALFGPAPAVFGHVAVRAGDREPLGFALWFRNFSTWRGEHGMYLEDLYVRPAARRTGAGRALLAALAAICVERGYPRLDWQVLDWNPARDFYHRTGAVPMEDWVPYRLSGDALRQLAEAAPVGSNAADSSEPGT
jgi:GNAT superfamily N-acetyltransferase